MNQGYKTIRGGRPADEEQMAGGPPPPGLDRARNPGDLKGATRSDSAFGTLECTMHESAKLIEQLEERLAPALVPEDAVAADAGDRGTLEKAVRQASPLVDRIDGLTAIQRALNVRLAILLARLEEL